MVKIIMSGCNGRMGRFITQIVEADPEAEIVAGIDPVMNVANTYPVFASIGACDVPADGVIDFSTASVVDDLLDYCQAKKLAIVECTTGLSPEQLQRLQDLSKEIPVFKSANMSLGINLLMKLVKDAARTLAEAGFDMEIVEKHHNQKLDAPSGTAIALADSINEEFDGAYEYVYDRSARRAKRPEKEIGISAVRGGTIVGEHDVIYAGTQEVITLSHTAYSREVFAKGAVQAAKYMEGKPAGFYNMSHVIEG